MLSPWSFDSQIQVQTATKTYGALGVSTVWTTTATLWASIVFEHKNLYTQVTMEYDQRLGSMSIYRIIVRSKQPWDYANTQFLYNDPNLGARIFKPKESPRFPGTRHTAYTSILVEDITDVIASPSNA